MGNPKAFLTIHRKEAGYRPIHDRIHDFGEVEQTLNSNDRRQQASRCMDCGVPFCHWACPLGNKAPEWNDALYKGDWELAYRLLNSTNDFPEFTVREGLRAQSRRARTYNQPRRRVCHYRTRIPGGLRTCRTTRTQRQESMRHRSRTCRTRGSQPPQPHGLLGHCDGEERKRRRLVALRHS